MRILLGLALLAQAAQDGEIAKINLLPPGINNPRNSEGDFVALKDGLLMFVFTKFTGGASDHSRAELVARYSGDGGKTWSLKDQLILGSHEAKQNVMSVSLLRLPDGRIGMFYLRKNSDRDCRPYLRFSDDEGHNWGDASPCGADEGYFVVNNSRVIQLKSGRIVVPAARHTARGEGRPEWSVSMCYLSDDGAKTWRKSTSELEAPGASRSGLQEPLVVELKDGRLMMLCRTDQGCQFRSYSADGGDTWSKAEPSNIKSPLSPASVARIPGTGDLLLAWNDHSNADEKLKGKRTPFTVAISRDEGATWEKTRTLDDDPEGWFCYTAITFVGERVLLAHCAGDATVGRLNRTRITSFNVDWLYK